MDKFQPPKRYYMIEKFLEGLAHTTGFSFSVVFSLVELAIVFKTLSFFPNDFENIIFCMLFMIYFEIRLIWSIVDKKFGEN